jgi:GxxExxY protein
MDTLYFPHDRQEIPDETGLNLITAGIIRAGFQVSNELGVGFMEKVYRNAVAHYLKLDGFEAETEHRVQVFLPDGYCVGEYYADILVNKRVIVELKVSDVFIPAHMSQVLNYLRASRLCVGLLLNFGTPRMGIRRIVNSGGRIEP